MSSEIKLLKLKNFQNPEICRTNQKLNKQIDIENKLLELKCWS